MAGIRVTLGELTFDVAVGGPEAGRPVLLLHGFPENARMWDGVLPRLHRTGLRTAAPDQRGYSPGARPAAVPAYAMGELVGDVLGLLDALGWPAVDLVGHDWGAAVAWQVAARHPDRVRTLTAVSVPHPLSLSWALRNDEEQQRLSAYVRLFRMPGKAEQTLLADGARRLRDMLAPMPAERADVFARPMTKPGALTAALNWYRAGRPDGEIGVIGVPTLYVWSTEDSAFGAAAAQETGRWVNGPYRFETLQGVSHWVPEEAPETLSGLLLEHLRSHGEFGTTAHTPFADSPKR
jgi:pimeloyl-ACP methyl ester carboxylesterase